MANRQERRRRARVAAPGGAEDPIRVELFSTERFEQHAATLAEAQRIDRTQQGRKLLPRVRENARVLRAVHAALTRATGEQRAITPAAEWLLDNFHVIEEQVHDICLHLPESYYRGLPKLADGFLAGYPRVYGIAWALVAHTDSRFDPALLTLFVDAYQRIQPLTLGELWALPMTLRILMMENLRRLAVIIRNSQAGRRLADAFVDEIEHAAEQGDKAPQSAGGLPSEALRQSYAVQISQRLHDPHPGASPSLDFLNDWLTEQGVTLDEVVSREHADQVAANTTVRNIIISMRAISALDWPALVERVSLVDAKLREGRGGYGGMDFLTRDRYRHAIEDLARRSLFSELEIAQRAMDLVAAAVADPGADAVRADPGYYLIGPGRAAFERAVGFQPRLRQRLFRVAMARADLAYPGGITALTILLLLALPLSAGIAAGLGWLPLVLIALCAFFPASDIATGLVNRVVAWALPPRHLPRLELAAGVPEGLRTLVAVPILLAGEADLRAQVEQMEVLYLANPEGAVNFALLSDWTDADRETMPDDAMLLDLAVREIAALNLKYSQERFFLFHRRRLWNPREGKWMGWERKRGKLHELNRLLRGATDTSFIALAGRPAAAPSGIRYVLTLDADTRLPIGAVSQLVGTAAHPLNRPVFDPVAGRVVAGYGILQPRVTPTLPLRGERSLYHRIFSGACGMDAYACLVSEVYQDLFGLGSYSGKGLYDVDIFESALAGRVPDNTMLSHDLFESVFARCGLVSDLELYEEFPSRTAVADSRAHRWTRGDWQLLPWILGTRGQGMPFLGRWQMLDNLRRSLSAPGALATLVLAWAIPGAPQGMLVGLRADGARDAGGVGGGEHPDPALRRPLRRPPSAVGGQGPAIGTGPGPGGAGPARTPVLADARRHRHDLGAAADRTQPLKWVTSQQAKAASDHKLASLARPFGQAAAGVATIGALVLLTNPAAIGGATPFLLLWLSAPLVAWVLSLPGRVPARERLTPEDVRQLRLIARRTWRYFATFVTARDHHLPPDNFQEDPDPVVAHRSSPTNFGLYLLSVLAARDFGWLGLLDAVDRLEATLSTLGTLPRLHGHFYNWYDTRDLRVLDPPYLSTVDSGNLAGHLLALAQGCREAARQPHSVALVWTGVADTHRLLSAAIAAIRDDRRTLTVSSNELRQESDRLGGLLAAGPTDEAAWTDLGLAAETLLDLVRAYRAERADADSDATPESAALEWAVLLLDDIRSHARDRAFLRAAAQDPSGAKLAALARRLEALAVQAERLCAEMDFGFLYNPERHLFSLGYRAVQGTLDESLYDLMASEARLTSLVAIAKRDVASEHWFHLARRMTRAAGGPVLLSWSGSMFEYLMPSLTCYTPRYSLLDQTCRRAVKRQIQYGRERGIPWGISESAYNQRDLEFTYQYSAFGVPGLGMKRGLAEDLVVAPYATALAAMYEPHAAAQNFARLERLGALGRYGFVDALDFTPARRPEDRPVALVRCYMSHHQGMSLVALDNAVHDGIMRHRFQGIPLIRATDLLLQEPSPRSAEALPLPVADEAQTEIQAIVQPPVRRRPSPTSAVPSAHLLSNGRYTAMVTAAGSGYSTWEGLSITRWREDATRDDRGTFLYLRDLESGRVWSAGYQPTAALPDRYEAVFLEDRVRIARSDGAISSELEILVSPEDDAEIRHLSLVNRGWRSVEIELTTYAEVVLAPPMADIAHPAFSNLFVQTELLSQARGLLARRRLRSPEDPQVWAAHLLCGGAVGEGLQYETDRARFIGRGRTLREPQAVLDGAPLSNTVGAVLDPIFSLRTRLQIAAGASAEIAFATLAAGSREALDRLIEKYRDAASYERVSARAWTHAQVQLHHLRIRPDEAQLFQDLANRLIYSDRSLRPSSKLMQLNRSSVAGLWRFGISGDNPIVLLRIAEPEHRSLVDQLLRAHEYWRLKRLAVDLVILNDKGLSYAQDLQDLLEGLVRDWPSSGIPPGAAQQGAVFVLRGDRLTDDEQVLLKTAARAVLASSRGTLAEQLQRRRRPDQGFVPRRPAIGIWSEPAAGASAPVVPSAGLERFNGLGGFAQDGREYAIVLGKGQWTPAPWVNVIANPDFGFVVSEAGSGFTWCLNSRENQLTPWSNDPVGDPPGEVFYLRDEDTGELWTPTALPIRVENATYVARHGQGYTRFEHASHGIASELLQLVDVEDPVKISRLTLRNDSGRSRRLRVLALCGVGAGGLADRLRALCGHRVGSRHRGLVRVQPLERGVWHTHRLCRPGRPANRLER